MLSDVSDVLATASDALGDRLGGLGGLGEAIQCLVYVSDYRYTYLDVCSIVLSSRSSVACSPAGKVIGIVRDT